MVNREELNGTGIDIDGVRITNDERQPCEIYTRVMGYLRPYSQFNDAKAEEFVNRREFVLDRQ